jgi:hypothetical protein
VKWFAASLLLLGVLRHYGYSWFPPEEARFIWNISGAVLILFLIWSAWPAARLVAIWLTFEELQVIACSLIRTLRPQPIGTGQDQCSALIGLDLGAVGMLLVALILVASLRHPVNPTGSQTKEKKP